MWITFSITHVCMHGNCTRQTLWTIILIRIEASIVLQTRSKVDMFIACRKWFLQKAHKNRSSITIYPCSGHCTCWNIHRDNISWKHKKITKFSRFKPSSFLFCYCCCCFFKPNYTPSGKKTLTWMHVNWMQVDKSACLVINMSLSILNNSYI